MKRAEDQERRFVGRRDGRLRGRLDSRLRERRRRAQGHPSEAGEHGEDCGGGEMLLDRSHGSFLLWSLYEAAHRGVSGVDYLAETSHRGTPDGIGTSTARLCATRLNYGNGRVYHLLYHHRQPGQSLHRHRQGLRSPPCRGDPASTAERE
jgi:hypothetical protein